MTTHLRKANKGGKQVLIEVLQKHTPYRYGKRNTVCISSVLSFFDITPDMYRFNWNSKSRSKTFINLLRKHGWRVGDRKKNLAKAWGTMNQLRDNLTYYIDPANRNRVDPVEVHYLVYVSGHVLVVDSKGMICVDTDARMDPLKDKRTVYMVWAVFKD